MADERQRTKSELKRLFSNLRRKMISDNMMSILIDVLWRDRVQGNWAQTDPYQPDFLKNKPAIAHIEADVVENLQSHTVNVEFKNEFTAIPAGMGNLKIYRLEPEEGEYILADVLFNFPSLTWLTTTGFTVQINSTENLTGIFIDYTFIEKTT
jgi:hypothetical protein